MFHSSCWKTPICLTALAASVHVACAQDSTVAALESSCTEALRTGLRQGSMQWKDAPMLCIAVIRRHLSECGSPLGEQRRPPLESSVESATAACVSRRLASDRARSLALKSCKEELSTRGMDPGRGDYKTSLDQCMRSAAEPDATTRGPFGGGYVNEYLNAMFAGDSNAMNEIDDRARRALGVDSGSLLNAITAAYLINFPRIYGTCLGSNPPTVRAGSISVWVKRDQYGAEVSRDEIDRRFSLKVKPELLDVARRSHLQTGDRSADNLVGSMFGINNGELSPGNITEVVTRAMQKYSCDHSIVRRIE